MVHFCKLYNMAAQVTSNLKVAKLIQMMPISTVCPVVLVMFCSSIRKYGENGFVSVSNRDICTYYEKVCTTEFVQCYLCVKWCTYVKQAPFIFHFSV